MGRIMKTITSRNGIQLTLIERLYNLDFVANIALLFHTQNQMRDKLTHLVKGHNNLSQKFIRERQR